MTCAGLLTLVALVFGMVYFFTRERDEFIEISVHYFNNEWMTEPHRLRLTNNTEQGLIEESIARLRRLPDQNPRVRSLPRAVYSDVILDDRLCIVFLTDEYNDMPLSDRVVTLVSLVYTLTEFHFISEVRIMAGDTRVGTYNRSNLLLTGERLPDRISTRVFTLYFADPSLSYLIAVDDEITIQPNRPIETQLIEELMSFATTDEFRRLIPTGVRLRNNTTLDGGICYIDFSTDFLAQIDNADTVLLIVNSIVNTIISNTNALQVQLLFAGDKTTAVHESIDLNMPLSRESFYGR